MSNGGTGRAVSLHVYGTDIPLSGDSSINRVFGQEVVDVPPDGARLVSRRRPDGRAQ
ncbi:hypothetical protein PUR71_37280 [Streptomyces sp. SP17BM10]|uniref:hypothetical protein n=1 Tax=Streptomyces sp. SP17BM10 TaxID=3002530 RepID=UPI002E770BA8|nr:hypothetical protein [Streptomyces sp. SP17BM10]MEE1788514.1 hypothetical protein [Streptomyces sp. SP17BM10]